MSADPLEEQAPEGEAGTAKNLEWIISPPNRAEPSSAVKMGLGT